MNVVGSKRKIARYILPIILSGRTPGQSFVEPFAGGMNITERVAGRRIANDAHFYLMSLWQAVIYEKWIPPDFIGEEEYIHVRDNKDVYPAYFVGFVGFAATFSAKWFGGYARGAGRNYVRERKGTILKQAPKLQGVVLSNVDYKEMEFPDNSLVYCDPPYQGALGYRDKLDHDEFWQWVRKQKLHGHTVYVSEYQAPDDFKCIWQKNTVTSLTKGDKFRVEKLFTI